MPVARRAVAWVGRASSVTCTGAAGLAVGDSGGRGEPSIEVVRMAGGLVGDGFGKREGSGAGGDSGPLLNRFG